MTTPPSAMGLVLFGSLLGSIGAAFLKAGAVALSRHWTSLVYNWKLLLGVSMYLISSVFFIMGISRGELSVLYPMVSLGYICTLIWSRIFFKERLTSTKLAGVGLILIGIVMMNLGNH
jgi:drug/metabolite transporter (DMT)-like permease